MFFSVFAKKAWYRGNYHFTAEETYVLQFNQHGQDHKLAFDRIKQNVHLIPKPQGLPLQVWRERGCNKNGKELRHFFHIP